MLCELQISKIVENQQCFTLNLKYLNEIVPNTLQNNAASFLFDVRRARTTKQKRITKSRGATLVELQKSKIVKIALRFTSHLNELFERPTSR